MDTAGKKLFKTSVVGGFNRNDVCAYIEVLVNNHNEEIAKLREELKASAAQNIELRQQADELSGKLETAEKKVTALESEIEEKSVEAEKAKALEQKCDEISKEFEDKNKAYSETCAEIAQLREKMDKYASLEEEYTYNKSRIAELELSAIARAAELENEAERKAQVLDEQAKMRYQENQDMIAEKRRAIQMEMNKIMADISSSYNRLQSELNGFNSRFEDLLSNTKANIQMLTKSACGISANFAALEQKCSKFMPEEEHSDKCADA